MKRTQCNHLTRSDVAQSAFQSGAWLNAGLSVSRFFERLRRTTGASVLFRCAVLVCRTIQLRMFTMLNFFTWLFTAILVLGTAMAKADNTLTEDFSRSPEMRWDYVADTVMGGVSSGQVRFLSEGDVHFARLTGTVSTANNGGFIQVRRKLTARPAADTSGIRLLVRGNGEQYFVHLRTRGTVLPWQYYQASFATSDSWTEIRLPLSEFRASGAMLRSTPVPNGITSVGIVAFGRDHQAGVDVTEIGFY